MFPFGKKQFYKKSLINLVLLSGLAILILHCNTSSQSSKKALTTSSGACPQLSTQEIKSSFGLNLDKPIDGSKLEVDKPKFALMDYSGGQQSLLLQANPKATSLGLLGATDDSDHPDYVKYTITDTKKEICSQGETGASLSKEILIPSNCPSGVLTISIQACAITNHLKDTKKPCGPITSSQYTHVANPRSSKTGDLNNTLQKIANKRATLCIIGLLLGNRARKFLSSIDPNQTSLSKEQIFTINLAQLFSNAQNDFCDIFSSDIYDSLREVILNDPNQAQNLALASTTAPSSVTCGKLSPQLVDETATDPTIDVDIKKILQDAQTQFAQSGNGSIINPTDGASSTTSSAGVANGADKTNPNSKPPTISYIGGMLIGIAVIYGVGVVAYYYQKSKTTKEDFFKNAFKERYGISASRIENFKSITDATKIEWVSTVDGINKVFTYDNKIIVLSNPNETDPLKKRYQLKDPKDPSLAGGIGPDKIKFEEAVLPTRENKTGKPSKFTIGNEEVFGTTTKKGVTEQKFSKLGIGVNIAITAGLAAIGSTLIAENQLGNLLVDTSQSDPYLSFISYIKSVEVAIASLRKDLAALEKIKTELILVNLNLATAKDSSSNTETSTDTGTELK